MIEAAVRTVLLENPAVAALVGNRIYGRVMPQRPTLPAITITKIDKTSNITLGRDAVGPNTLRIQVDCWAKGDEDTAGIDAVRALAIAVNGSDDQSTRGALHAFAGRREGVTIKSLELIVEKDAQPDEMEPQVFRVSADYRAHL